MGGLVKDKDNNNGKGGKGGDGGKGGGKGGFKGGKKGKHEDDDWLDEAQMVHVSKAGGQVGGAVVVSSAKEKEIKKIEKSLPQIEILEKELDGGKNLDKTQLAKIEKKEEL